MNDRMFGMKLLAIMNSMIIFGGYVLSDTGCRPIKYELTERPMRAELILKIGADKENEDFYKPRSFAVDRTGRIFILDSGNSRIQCFSKEGAFRFSFGKPGQGPGELSKTASNIKILNDGNIYVIDNGQRRINVYTLEGKFLFFGKTSVYYDDIVLIDNTYYLSSILLKENYKPIDVSRTLGKVDGSFGIFVEPAVGLVREIDKLPIPGWDRLLSGSGFTNLIVGKNNEMIFSQNNPYRLIKYDLDGRTLRDVSGDAGFDTFFRVNFTAKKNEVSVSNPRMARVLDMSVRDNDFLIVPFLDPERDYFYVDIYDLELNLISRHKMLNGLLNDKKHEYLGRIFIDDEDHLYGLVNSQSNPPQLVKYQLLFD